MNYRTCFCKNCTKRRELAESWAIIRKAYGHKDLFYKAMVQIDSKYFSCLLKQLNNQIDQTGEEV